MSPFAASTGTFAAVSRRVVWCGVHVSGAGRQSGTVQQAIGYIHQNGDRLFAGALGWIG